MAKKKQKEEVKEVEFETPTQNDLGVISIQQKKYEDCEWCFQFDEDKPQVFAWTDDQLNKQEDPKVIFTITNVENSYITFTNGESGKCFKIFARELSDEGRVMREKQREAFSLKEADMENFDQKMEEYASENKEA
jgi:hypothetical protein